MEANSFLQKRFLVWLDFWAIKTLIQEVICNVHNKQITATAHISKTIGVGRGVVGQGGSPPANNLRGRPTYPLPPPPAS